MIQRRAVLAAMLAACAPSIAAAEAPPMPPLLANLERLALTQPDGAATTLGDHLRAAPSIISFWATWCPPCATEARHLARLRVRFGDEALNIVGINMDRERNEARIAQFLSRANATYTQLRGDTDVYRAFGGGTDIVLPRAFVFRADGRPMAAFGRFSPGVTTNAMDRAVESAMTAA